MNLIKWMVEFVVSTMLTIVLSSSIYAYCESLTGNSYNDCISIYNSDLSNKEKDLLYANLIYTGDYFPNHDLVYNWNTNKEFVNPPENVEIKNGMFIKNAWNKILAVMPSVLDNELYVPSNINVLNGFHYDLEIPNNYQGNYPNTNNGDCKRTYNIAYNNAYNNIYLNDELKGNGKLISLAITQNSTIKSKYKIDVGINIEHYKWHEYCCGRDRRDWCYEYCGDCRYDRTEHLSDSIAIEDSLNVKYYNKEFYTKLDVVDNYKNTLKLKLDFTDSVKLNFQDSSYIFYKYYYDVISNYAPYYILTITAKEVDNEIINNLHKDDNNLFVTEQDNCQLAYWNFFKEENAECSLDFNKPYLRITTDQLTYKVGDTIKVDIFPENLEVKIKYGSQEFNAKNNAEFIAEPLKNKITAEYKDIKAERIVFINEKSRFQLAWNLSIFGFLNYGIYLVLKKYLGGLL